jgi:hypothetical protein
MASYALEIGIACLGIILQSLKHSLQDTSADYLCQLLGAGLDQHLACLHARTAMISALNDLPKLIESGMALRIQHAS